MSNPPTETGACSREVEALFELGRAAYAPTDADCARVRSALARKLAEASVTGTAPVGLGNGASGLTASHVVAVGIGVACLVVGALALMRAVDARQASTTAPRAVQTRAAGEPDSPTRAERVSPQPATVTAPPDEPEPVRAQGTAPVPSHARAFRARSATQKTTPSTAARSAAKAPVLAQAAVAARDAVSEPPVAARPSASTPATSPEPQPTAADTAAPQARPQHSPTEAVPAEAHNQGDARAELGLIARMHAALQQANPKLVLALCAEHERRWPHGTFVQEREGLRAVAACSAGAAAAGALARVFLSGYPRGPLSARVRDACGAEP